MKALYVLTGILCFLAALLFTLPPEKALRWWGDDLQVKVQLYAPQGGLARGSAAAVDIDGLRLGETRWRLRFISLLKGRLGYVIRSNVESQPASTILEFGLGGRVVVHDLNASLPLRSILPLLGNIILPIDGWLMLDLPYLDVRDQQLFEATGQIQLRNGTMTFMRPPLALGSYEANIETADQVITATISDADGAPVDAEGSLNLKAEGTYALDLRLRARATTEQRLRNQLNALGRPDAQGWYRLKSRGQL